jgi:N-acetylglutamate synthase-like GNAT family acetyltransferase
MPEGVEVVRTTLETIEEYTKVMAEGWSMDPGPVAAFHRRGVAHPTHGFYVARVDGETAGCANHVECGTSAYFIGGVVLPKFRGRGVYRAMIARRLQDCAAAGIPLVVTHARAETSAPMLAHLGFETVCKFESYSPP